MNGFIAPSRRYKAVILFGILVLLFLLIFRKNQFSESQLKALEIGKKCYELKKTNEAIKLLDDVMKSPPKLDRTIFFHDTSCKKGIVSFTARQACAIESAAKWNPDRDIFVLFAAPVGFSTNGIIDAPILKALSLYPNVQYRNVDWYNYAVGSSAEEWVKEDIMLTSIHYLGHLSDFIRILSLYHFGGIHLDLDFVVQKSFKDLPPNFVGAYQHHKIQNAVLGFESKDVGHKILEMILRDFVELYSTKLWYVNGPAIVTKIVLQICKAKNSSELKPELCWGLKIYEPSAFFPIHYSKWKEFFETDPTIVKDLLKKVEDAFAIHFNNKVSYEYKISKSEPTNIYRILAEKNCPKVMEASGGKF